MGGGGGGKDESYGHIEEQDRNTISWGGGRNIPPDIWGKKILVYLLTSKGKGPKYSIEYLGKE
jgi:hypothetical protein